jgi:hypothetical protein
MRVVEEDNLINQRMNWMLWSESIILTLWGALTAASFAFHPADLPWFRFPALISAMEVVISIMQIALAVIGIIISFIGNTSIYAARKEVEHIRDTYAAETRDINFSHVRIMSSVTAADDKHLRGHMLAKYVPWFFCGIWCLLLACSVFAFVMVIGAVSGVGPAGGRS